MKKSPTIFLKAAILLIGAVVLAVCIFALPVGVREEGASGYGPIFWGMYITTIPFYIALYQGLKLLWYIDKNKAFSQVSIKALKVIKYCAFAIAGMYAVGMPYIYIVADYDDAPGVIAIGLVVGFASLVIAVFTALLQKLLQSAIDIKSENDLTV